MERVVVKGVCLEEEGNFVLCDPTTKCGEDLLTTELERQRKRRRSTFSKRFAIASGLWKRLAVTTVVRFTSEGFFVCGHGL